MNGENCEDTERGEKEREREEADGNRKHATSSDLFREPVTIFTNFLHFIGHEINHLVVTDRHRKDGHT